MARSKLVVDFFRTVLGFLLQFMIGVALWFVPLRLRPKKNIKNQVVLVTGAGSGLGRALALRLAARGARIVLWDQYKQWVDETQSMIQAKGGKAWSFVCDVSDRKAVRETATKVKNQVGPVNILVNNAGVLFGKSLLELEEEAIVKTMAVNCLAHFWLIKAFLPDMIASGRGQIVCVASAAGFLGTERMTDYTASKHAAVGLAKSLRAELMASGHHGVKVTVVSPYFFASGFYRGLGQGIFPEISVDQVADKTLEAILTEKFMCFVPWWLEGLVRFTSFVPSFAEETGFRLLGIGDMMKNFTGARHVPLKKNNQNR